MIMPTVTECICCHEIEMIEEKIEESDSQICCIIEHKGFDAVCLNLWVLQTAFYDFRYHHGSQAMPVVDNKTHR